MTAKNILDIHDDDRFHLTDTFVEQYRTKTPDFGGNGLGEVVYRRTYSRSLEGGGQEEWWQTVRRVVEGEFTIQKWHCRRNHLPWNGRKAQATAQETYRLIFEMKFLPPGRGLWSMGTDYIERHGGMSLWNCAVRSTEDVVERLAAPFEFVCDVSMLGVGVGYDTKGAGKVAITDPQIIDEVHVVEDSREGWVAIIGRVIDAYGGFTSLPRDIDYSQIRPAGTPLKGFGGVAAGAQPLIDCIEALHGVFDGLIGKRLTSTAIVDAMDLIGRCVVSGNVRRSALLAAGDADDMEFLSLKDPDLFPEELLSHRWASNNSVFAEVGMDYRAIADQTARNGEPGFMWLDNARGYGRMSDPRTDADAGVVATNPCGEIFLESGALCNLVETFPSRHGSYAEYERTLKAAYLWAKTVTLIPTHRPETNQIQFRTRRIGLSQSGIQQAMQKHGRREMLKWCDRGYAFIRQLDAIYSDWLAIPRSIKVTTVKPSGSVSTLPYVTPGIHFEHAPFYYRTVRMSKNNPLVATLQKAGYRVEDDVYDKSASVVYFPIKAEYFERSKTDVTIWEQLELAAQMQELWADNSVSITVTFKPEEAGDIARALELYESRLKSVSFLPLQEHGYAQAPYITITEDEYVVAIKKIKPLRAKAAGQHDSMDAFCDGDSCLIPVLVSAHAD